MGGTTSMVPLKCDDPPYQFEGFTIAKVGSKRKPSYAICADEDHHEDDDDDDITPKMDDYAHTELCFVNSCDLADGAAEPQMLIVNVDIYDKEGGDDDTMMDEP